MPKIKATPRTNDTVTIKAKTTQGQYKTPQGFKWWKAQSDIQLAREVLSTATYLKEMQQFRYRQAGIFTRLYGNMPLHNFVGSGMNNLSSSQNLPVDRPTMNVIQSVVDTKISRITQARPRPLFLTDAGNWKQRHLAKQMNGFIQGEFYQTRAYELGEIVLRDCSVLGSGAVKIVESLDEKVALERRLVLELLVDPNESLYGNPRQLYEFKLVDRSILAEYFPKKDELIETAENAFPDNSGDASRTVADQIMVVEAWHLPSSKNATDGRHVIGCTEGILLDESWTKEKFPFVFLHDTPRILGFWAQGAAERLLGTQTEINMLLQTISASINLVGVPRVFVEEGSKVIKSHINNQIGAIVTYRGTPPSYQVAPCMPQEVYAQLQRLIDFAYQQEGVSQMSAQSTKPAGLNSGEALREYDNLQVDRMYTLSKRYATFFEDLAYAVLDKAIEIAKRTGKYETVYPDKTGMKQIDLPKVEALDDPFVIQCFDSSSLPKDPSGRLDKVTELMQAGIVTPQEGRRLLDYPDLEQEEMLANSGEERILKDLDDIVMNGKFNPPDSFVNLELANQLVVQYINLYTTKELSESRMGMLRDYFTQIQSLTQAAQPPPQQGQPMAQPMPAPQSSLLPISQ